MKRVFKRSELEGVTGVLHDNVILRLYPKNLWMNGEYIVNTFCTVQDCIDAGNKHLTGQPLIDAIRSLGYEVVEDLAVEPLQHNGKNNNVELSRLKCRVAELEAALETANEVNDASNKSRRNLYTYAIAPTDANFNLGMGGLDVAMRDCIKELNARITELDAQLAVKDETISLLEKGKHILKETVAIMESQIATANTRLFNQSRVEQKEPTTADTLQKLVDVLRDALGEQWVECATVARAIDAHITARIQEAKQ